MDKIIPVVVLKNVEETEKTLNALKDNNINTAEICFRTDCAEDAIKLAVEKFPEMNIGAGTVINKIQCKNALKAGAKFIVSPGLSKEVAKVCKKNSVPYFPGVVSPTEIMEALKLGLSVLKFFPSNCYGGLKTMKALSSAFPQVKFIPTGGVDSTNIEEYLAWDKIYAVGGSSFVKESLEKCQK
ncbi:MAG: bifunctional 4-hydroxy-2-oxoglutarate aldolase/2-dehydro-3-deoxy-phosphogluconate aldolase [Clostridia bacterium]|nr:bifunctional 4-hydroxy-2-oxoglutarate aldolase/2-dehydro-3-deoxy-phosphogluconate aldolase [Clostridia bacterium]